jgi:hypothetical protein
VARLVLAIGTSHSPALNTSAADYLQHAERDYARKDHLDKDGRTVDYDTLLSRADPAIAAEIEPAVIARRVAACEADIARLSDVLAEAAPDTVIVVGDDQREQYLDDNMPAMLVYWGETIRNEVLQLPDDAPAYWKEARAQFHEETAGRDYPVDAAFGRHLVETLIACEFDISQARELARPRGEGHAFGFVHRRLLRAPFPAILPVVLNTYYPPNQPTPGRCYALGRAIAEAVESWPGDGRFAIIGSGGLSHFTVDEDLDRSVLEACRTGDRATFAAIPAAKLNSGNSEIRNWIVTAGAAEGLSMDWSDYQPCYRTPAGTGCAMAFAVWR